MLKDVFHVIGLYFVSTVIAAGVVLGLHATNRIVPHKSNHI